MSGAMLLATEKQRKELNAGRKGPRQRLGVLEND
jgi:hypothetical protein